MVNIPVPWSLVGHFRAGRCVFVVVVVVVVVVFFGSEKSSKLKNVKDVFFQFHKKWGGP